MAIETDEQAVEALEDSRDNLDEIAEGISGEEYDSALTQLQAEIASLNEVLTYLQGKN
jgi:uncharacterized protein YukE